MGRSSSLSSVFCVCPQEYSKFSDEGASKRLKFSFAPFSPVKLAADIAAITGMKAQHAGVDVVVRPRRCRMP